MAPVDTSEWVYYVWDLRWRQTPKMQRRACSCMDTKLHDASQPPQQTTIYEECTIPAR
jgi:hypothetical protein